jgi:O-antigen/teichoic acid export membrane protein
MNGLRKAVFFATGDQQFLLGANFVIAVVTSRLMPPNEIGVAVLGAAAVGLITALREYATSTYLIKHSDRSQADLQGALSAIIFANALLLLGLALIAPLAGWLYADDRVTVYLRILSVALMIEAFAMPVLAVLRSELEFAQAAAVSAMGTLFNLVTTLVLAWLGYGFTSFAIGILAGTTASAVMGLILRPRFWFFRPTLTAWRDVFAFGGYNGTSSLLRQLFDSMPYLVLGHFLSLDAVAYYHRALMLSQLPAKLLLSGVENLMLPALVKQGRQSASMKDTFLRTIDCVTGIYWPAILVAAILADPLIRLLYGEAWLPAAPIFQIMAVAAMFVFMGKLDASMLVAAGGLKDLVKRSLIAFPLSAAISTVGAMLGVMALAWSYWITNPILLFTSLIFLRRHIAFTWADLGGALSRSAVVSLISAAIPLALVIVFGSHDVPLAMLCAASISAVLMWFFALWLTRHTLWTEATARRPGPEVSDRLADVRADG